MAERSNVTDILRAISEDRALGSALCFPHRHPQESPAFHVSIMDLWRSAAEFVVIEAFRQAGKTTLSEEFLLLEACFGNFRYCLIFGETYTKACQRIAAIKHEALNNTKLMHLFGNLRSEPWTENRICLANGVLIEAHGWEEEIRGYKWLDARPDRAYLDDIEDETMVRDKAAVDATWRKLNMQLIPAMDKDRRRVRLTGTPLADDCVVNRCKASSAWVAASFPIVTAPGCSGVESIDHPMARAMWPERYPLDWVRRERKSFEDNHLLREFVQEFMLVSAQTQGKPFTSEMIRYDDLPPLGYSPRVLVVDPARTSSRVTSDRTGRVVISRTGTRIYVHESSGEFWKPDEIIADCFDTSHKHDDCEVAIERNSLDEFLMQPLRAEMMRRGQTIDLTPILAPGDRSKEQFILGLQPWFKAGDIILVGGKGKHQQLVAEILNFPSGKRDIINALAYAQRVFGGQPVYPEFGQDNIATLSEPGQHDQLAIAMHQTTREFAAVLVAISGRRVTVLFDFLSMLSAGDAIKDIQTLVRAAYPNRRVTTWVAADLYDQQGRVPLTEALKLSQTPVYRGGYVAQARGCLGELMRTKMEGERLLMVDMQAKSTLRALASGYRFAVGRDGRAGGEPEDNASRSVAICLEILTAAVEAGKTAQSLPEGFGLATSASGAPYLSALHRPNRSR